LPGYYPIRDYIVLPASIIALAIYIAITVVIIRNKKVYDFFNEVIMELKKVSWPSFEESKASTWVVIVVCVIFAVYLGIADILFSKIFTFFLAL
jgi:preprotein translocase subunit SecE